MGLGPHGALLSERVLLHGPGLVWTNAFAMQLEGIARREARLERAIYLSSRNRAPRKPEAPVTPTEKVPRGERRWIWIGEDIQNKTLLKGFDYSAEYIRKMGFKLPKIGKKR